MKNIVCILIAVCGLMACNHPDKELKQRIAGADSVAINYFKGDGTMDTVVAVKIIRDKKQVLQLVDLITEKQVYAKPNCGFDGSLHFFKMNQVVQDIEFRMNANDCMQFTFLKYGKVQATALPEQAKDLIESFKK